MNRKLHNTILAFSVTGVMLFFGLVVAQPALPSSEEAAPTMSPVVVTVAHAHHDGLADAAIAARIDARAKAFEGEFARAGTTGEALALTAGFIAATATEAVLISALTELRQQHADDELVVEDDAPATGEPQARRSGSTRDAIAMPYFSFARGSRGGSRS